MRREDWPQILDRLVQQARDVPFCWGQHDCVHWAITVAEELTERAWAPALPEYSDAAGALAVVHRLGFDGLLEAVTHYLGEPVRPSFAQRGDLTLVGTNETAWPLALAVCLGHRAAVPGEQGLRFVPMSSAVAAWRVE